MPRSRLLIIFFVVSFAVSGIIEGLVDEQTANAVYLIHAFVIAVLCFAWCKADVAELNITEPTGSAIFCALLPVVGVPVHFFRTRRVRSALVATLKAIGVLAVSIFLYALALYSGEYALVS